MTSQLDDWPKTIRDQNGRMHFGFDDPIISIFARVYHYSLKGYLCLYEIWDLYIFLAWDHVSKVFTIWPWLTSNELWPALKIKWSLYSITYNYIWQMLKFPFLRYDVTKISCEPGWPQMTFILCTYNGILVNSMRHTYLLNGRSAQIFLLEISCSQHFHNLIPLTSNDLWPLL